MRRIGGLAALGMIALMLLSLLGHVLGCVWDADTYGMKSRAALSEWSEEEITAYIGMDAQTQQACAERIRDYFAGRAEDMDFILPDGTPAFNAKELSHMQDVRGLVALGVKVVLVLSALLVAVVCCWWRVQRRAPWEAADVTLRGMLAGAIGLAAIVLIIALWAVSDFRAVFERFHRLVFTNENWLLDPRTDRLIRMMPQQLFEMLCVEIALRSLGIPLLAVAGAGMRAYALKRKKGKR